MPKKGEGVPSVPLTDWFHRGCKGGTIWEDGAPAEKHPFALAWGLGKKQYKSGVKRKDLPDKCPL